MRHFLSRTITFPLQYDVHLKYLIFPSVKINRYKSALETKEGDGEDNLQNSDDEIDFGIITTVDIFYS